MGFIKWSSRELELIKVSITTPLLTKKKIVRFGQVLLLTIPTMQGCQKILSSRRIRDSSRHVFPGGAGRGTRITIDINSSIQVSSSCQT